jgi:hypothetical protein
MNINLCETCVHWNGENCNHHFLDPALCGGQREPRASEAQALAKAIGTLKGIG